MSKPDELCRMTDHPNLYDYALTILKKKGLKLLLWPNPTEENLANCTYFAKIGGRNFDAQDPLRLLGMISIWEEYGDDWYHNPKAEIENMDHFLMRRAYPSSLEDFEKLNADEFKHFVTDYQEFFELHMFPKIKIKDDISRKEFYDIVTTFYKMEDEED